MRNIGVIFILALIGMLIWKASVQERPVLSTRVASAAINLQAEADTPLPRSVDLNSPGLPAEKMGPQNRELTLQPQKNLEEADPRVETKAVKADMVEVSEQNSEPKDRVFERIIIPSIKVNAKIVTKPYTELTWDLTSLGHDVAALDDVPTQTTGNNLVFAGHVTVRNGSHGPFRYLFRLLPGDIVILEDEEYTYTYSVRDQILVYPEESSVLNDTPNLQLTLITCTTYDEETSTYLRRRIILADLEKVELKEVLHDKHAIR
jgi:LPXTG-site transpeptidase (sortase) family protein